MNFSNTRTINRGEPVVVESYFGFWDGGYEDQFREIHVFLCMGRDSFYLYGGRESSVILARNTNMIRKSP